MLDLILQMFSLMLDFQLFSLMFDLILQLFSLMLHKNASDKFSFESCKFTIQRSKESTGRWSNIAITMVNQEKTRKGWNFQWNNDYFSGLSFGAWASWTPSLLRFFKFGKYNIMFLKASYGGSNLGSRAFTHFNSGDYEVKNISSFFLLLFDKETFMLLIFILL